ncbi:MAG: hypothetical protein V2A54_09020 [Bacteroidota bacterium]
MFFGILFLSAIAAVAGCRTGKSPKVRCYDPIDPSAVQKKDSTTENKPGTSPVCYGAPANPNLK